MKHITAIIMLVCIVPGCESPATKLALAGNTRSTAVQQWVVREMHSELTKALFRETRESLENSANADGRALALTKLGGRLESLNQWYRWYQDAQAVHDSTLLAHVASSGSAFGLASEALKARVASLAVPADKSSPASTEMDTTSTPEAGSRATTNPSPSERAAARKPLHAKLAAADNDTAYVSVESVP